MSARNNKFFSQIGIDVNKVIWFSNYLPYSIEQSEMDYLVIESDDGYTLSKVYLIEFIKNAIDESHIYRSLLYSKWVDETLSLGETITHPMIICPESYDFLNGETTPKRKEKANILESYIQTNTAMFSTNKLQVFTYDFSTGEPVFHHKR